MITDATSTGKSRKHNRSLLNKVPQIMDTIFTNLENNKTFDSYRLVFNLAYKLNLIRSDEYIALSNLSISIYYTWKKYIYIYIYIYICNKYIYICFGRLFVNAIHQLIQVHHFMLELLLFCFYVWYFILFNV